MSPQELRARIKQLTEDLESCRVQLDRQERACNHRWSEVKYDPIYQDGYTIEGDPPGTRGVDWRGPCHVPSKTTDRWTRTCQYCGKTETTTRSTDEIRKRPEF